MYRFLLSARYFRSRFLALAALLAITFGVAMLVIVLGIMGGYHQKLQENIRGQEAHLRVVGPGQYALTHVAEIEERLRQVPNVRATAPFIERLGVYRSPLSFRPCLLHGIAPRKQLETGDLGRFVLREEELDRILRRFGPSASEGTDDPPRPDRTVATRAVDAVLRDPDRSALDGDDIERFFCRQWRERVLRERNPRVYQRLQGDIPPAALVGVQWLLEGQMVLGQVITVITLGPGGTSDQPMQDFVVAGALKTGDFDQDSGAIYAELGLVRNFLGLVEVLPDGHFVHRVQGIRVALADGSRLEESRKRVEAAVREILPGTEVKTWKDLRRNLLKAVMIEKFLVYFLVLILVFFTGSMILLMLLLAVIEKTRDTGILMSLGATPQGVTSIFLMNGGVICLLGTILGSSLGLAFCSRINDIHDFIYDVTGWSLFQAEIYHMDRIPIALDLVDILLATVPPVLIGLMASLIPALWAPRRDPIRAIQHE